MAFRRILLCLGASLCAATVSAQSQPASDYTGTLGSIHLILHLTQTEIGQPTATLDSPDQGTLAIPAGLVTLAAGHLSVTFPTLHATFIADQSPDALTLTGTWTQGTSIPLILHLREPFVPAAVPSAVDGDWTGALPTGSGPLPLLLHITSDHHGIEFLTFDSPSQHLTGLLADNVLLRLNNPVSQLTFDLPAVHGHYTGRLTPDAATLAGTWTQGTDVPLSFTRIVPFVPATRSSLADGEWTGAVSTPQGSLHVLLHIRSDRTGTEFITLDSPDQLATGYEATRTGLQGSTLTFDLAQLHGTFFGTLTPTALDGTWTQTAPQPLSLPAHFTHPSAVNTPASLAPAPIPLTLAALHARLDAELKPLLENPTLAGSHDIGVAIGIVAHGQRHVYTYGTALPASVFEIGSITKTFTGLLLAQAVAAGTVTLDTPIRSLLPLNSVAKAEIPEITLLSLATHHSGLPRLPSNFHPANPLNPYTNYTLSNLYTFLAAHGTALPPHAPYLYSNVGVALLGQALALHAALPYEALLQRNILSPLHLTHTSLAIQPTLPGHTEDDEPTPAWDLNAFAPAGGLRCDVGDLLTYVESQLHPPTAFAQAIALQHKLQADVPNGRIGLAWHHVDLTGDYWHNGGTGGFTSYVFFNLERALAAVVLVNRSSALADSLGLQIAALLEGRIPDPLRH